MNIKKAIITHHAPVIPYSGCGFLSFGANSKGKIRANVVCYTYNENGDETSESHFIEYDVSKIIEGITYRQGTSSNLRFIEGIRLLGDTLHIDIHDQDNDFTEFALFGLTEKFKYGGYEDVPEIPEELTHTAVFPPAETKAEWVDRMERILAHCAQNFEAAMGSHLSYRYYTRLHDAATAKPSTNYLIRQTNTSVHCRWQIGWFWERVDRIKRKSANGLHPSPVRANDSGGVCEHENAAAYQTIFP